MVTAPVSCRAATNRAPLAWSALVRWKLPLPTNPKKSLTPSWASARPMASATRTGALPFDQCEHARRAAGTARDGQRPRNYDSSCRGEAGQVGELRESVLAGTQQEGVAWKGGIKTVRLSGVGADGLHADPDDRCLRGQPLCALDRDARSVGPCVIGVQETPLVICPGVP